MTNEDGPRILHPAQIRAGVNGEMLRREAICKGVRFFGGRSDECDSMCTERLMRDGIVFRETFGLEYDLFRKPRLQVMKIASASGSCSACATRSAAMPLGSPASLVTTISVGPGGHVDSGLC